MNYDKNTREGRHLTPEERIALQAEEIKQLQKENNGWQERYYELDAGHSRLFKDFCKMRDALIIANNYMPDIGHFCTCGKCKRCGTDINYAGYKYCLKCARNIIDAALSDTPADYHNPADVEALRKARKALYAARVDVLTKETDELAREALAEIDKVMGGKEW